MSTKKRQVRTLLNKATLTGFEVAQVVMHDLYEAYKTCEPFVFDEVYGLDAQNAAERLIIPDLEGRDAFLEKNLSGNRSKGGEYNDWLNGFHPFLDI